MIRLQRVRVLVVAAMVASSALAAAERATTENIVVIGVDSQLTEALQDALVPAAIVVLSEVGTPSLGDLPARSREVADRSQASATIWLVPAGIGTTLVTYDRAADRMLVRELPYQSPLSGTQAAETAQIVRTMLGALRDRPEADRTPPPPPPPILRDPQLAVSVGAGVWIAAPAADGALAGTLTAAWRPHGLGVAAMAAIAPSAEVMTSTFAGRVRDLAFAAEVRNAIVLAPRWRISPGFGMALHAIRFTGSFAGGDDLASTRYDPALRIGLTLGYELPNVEVGLAVSADCLLRRQKYEDAASQQILVIPRFQGITGFVVGVRL